MESRVFKKLLKHLYVPSVRKTNPKSRADPRRGTRTGGRDRSTYKSRSRAANSQLPTQCRQQGTAGEAERGQDPGAPRKASMCGITGAKSSLAPSLPALGCCWGALVQGSASPHACCTRLGFTARARPSTRAGGVPVTRAHFSEMHLPTEPWPWWQGRVGDLVRLQLCKQPRPGAWPPAACCHCSCTYQPGQDTAEDAL